MVLSSAQEPRTLRRGLPRVAGGEPWPPALEGVAEQAASLDASDAVEEVPRVETAADAAPVASEAAPAAASPGPEEVTVAASPAPEQSAAPTSAGLRRGLPRTPGGEPWPPAGAGATADTGVPAAAPTSDAASEPEPASPDVVAQKSVEPVVAAAPAAGVDGAVVAVRRGLPRVAGGDPWPPEGTAPVIAAPAADAATSSPAPVEELVEEPRVAAPALVVPAAATTTTAGPVASAPTVVDAAASTAPASSAVATAERLLTPIPFTPGVYPGRYAFTRPAPEPEPERLGPFTRGQWAGAAFVGGAGLLFAAAMAVLFVRWLLTLEPLEEFLRLYPGEYHLPEGAPVGFPGWLGWQHFFNVFLMVLIIRSGLRVRTEKRPTAFWVSRKNKKSKISLNLWFHQALDILWLINGVVFVVLLFLTGQWMRVIPTSWEVFPNALSAVLQYVSLDWPTENGWVNYNSLQQLAYFATIFLAAPLAAITGYRMSGMWPKDAKTLNRIYPVEWARAVHFPVMLYFVAFIFVHVALVLSTGALRNLNHMYAAQGSSDPTAYAENWLGFWLFVASLVVIAAAWVAARPLVLAPIAKLFGNVSGR